MNPYFSKLYSSTRLQQFSKILIVILVCFLPLSAWLVSMSGKSVLSGGRDLLILLLFVLALPRLWRLVIQKQIEPELLLAIGFIFWTFLSFIWREASFAQWLKGLRFISLPILLFLSVRCLEIAAQYKEVVLKAVAISAAVICALCGLELVGISLPLATSHSGVGALSAAHVVQGTSLLRLQAILAGPNALGLYFIAVIGYAIWAVLLQKRWGWVLLIATCLLLPLTFSRSSLVGLLSMGICIGYLATAKRYGKMAALVVTVIVMFCMSAAVYGLEQRSHAFVPLLTHEDSSQLRVVQYQRIWNSSSEIGLLGRGPGTAGPASQNRLDGGPNHWTENTYLDVFEELGLVGLALYLGLFAAVLKRSWERQKTPLGLAVLVVSVGFAVTGLFINSGTGQAGICLFWLLAAL